MKETMFQQGTDLLMFGMGTVFSFLTLMVLATTLMSFIINRYFPEPEAELVPVRVPKKSIDTTINPKHMAIIKAAIEKHRSHQKS